MFPDVPTADNQCVQLERLGWQIPDIVGHDVTSLAFDVSELR